MPLSAFHALRVAFALTAVMAVAGCNTIAPSDQPARSALFPASPNQIEELSSSLMRVGYRYKRAGETDQFIMPPERFMITAVDGAPVTMTTTSNAALPVSPGQHSISVAASGGLLKAESIINITITKNRTYQPTGWLNNTGTPAFIVWIEDSETGRPASAKTSMAAQRR